VPFKANADRRHRIPRQRFRVTNWREYDASLRQRGSLTVWFTEEAIAAWMAAPRTTRGGQTTYSALAILTALSLKAVFRLALRQTEGLIGSVIGLLGLDLAVPDHSTLSRRAATLDVPRPRSSAGAEPLHLLVDSAGLKLCGAGEWLNEKHGTKVRRSWRKLHLGLDAGTGRIVASLLTTRDVDDGSQVGALLDQVEARSPPSPATEPMTRRVSPPASASATRTLPSSCRRARMRCRATRPRPRPRSATATFGASPSTAAWLGRRRPATLGVPGPRPPWRATSR